jgi:hypothetical protein
MHDLIKLPPPAADMDLLQLTRLALVQDEVIRAAANAALKRFYAMDKRGSGVMARMELRLDFGTSSVPPATRPRACGEVVRAHPVMNRPTNKRASANGMLR